jgi:hypothetical protein
MKKAKVRHYSSKKVYQLMVIRPKKCFFAVNVKAKTSKAKSIKTVLNHSEKYHISHVLKFGDYNVGRDGAILTVPSYMGFLLEFEGIEDIELPLLDINEVNRLAKEMLAE